MIITRTPLRISFAGGFTDFEDFWREEGGAVLCTTIAKYIYVIVKPRFDDLIVLSYSRREVVERVEDIQHELMREAMWRTGVRRGVEIVTLADIPGEGCGLGSSSSVTVGLLNALYAYRGEAVNAERLAREACQIEIEILHKSTGIQDQYIAAHGNLCTFRFQPDGRVEFEPVMMPEPLKRRLEAHLHLFYLGNTRQADPILTHLKTGIPRTRPILGQLRDKVWEMRDLLLQGKLDDFGLALHQAWLAKRSLSGAISNGDIDYLYQQALEAGALGGKVTGAGGGGFFLVYCSPSLIHRVRQRLSHLQELPFSLEPEGSKIILHEGLR